LPGGYFYLKAIGNGLLTALCVLLLFQASYKTSGSLELARTLTLNAYIFIRLSILTGVCRERDNVSISHAGGKITAGRYNPAGGCAADGGGLLSFGTGGPVHGAGRPPFVGDVYCVGGASGDGKGIA
jgi:hypothetical protein